MREKNLQQGLGKQKKLRLAVFFLTLRTFLRKKTLTKQQWSWLNIKMSGPIFWYSSDLPMTKFKPRISNMLIWGLKENYYLCYEWRLATTLVSISVWNAKLIFKFSFLSPLFQNLTRGYKAQSWVILLCIIPLPSLYILWGYPVRWKYNFLLVYCTKITKLIALCPHNLGFRHQGRWLWY